MTGRPATYATDDIIQAIEKLREDPRRDVNVNQIRALLNGGNRDRIRRVLDEYQNTKAGEVAQADAKAQLAQFGKLEQEVREQAGETLAAHMQSVTSLLVKAAEAERAKAQQEISAAKEAFEMRLRDRDADVDRAKDCHSELCALLDEVNSELDAAYASAEQLTAQRDAMARERDRLGAEADRLAAENARLSAELNKRKSRVRKPRAAVPVGAAEKHGSANTAQPKSGPDREAIEQPAARGASDVGANVLQGTMFSLATGEDGGGTRTEKVQSTSMDGSDIGQPDARNAQVREAGDSGSKPSAPSRAGVQSLRAVGAVSPGPAGALGAGGAGG